MAEKEATVFIVDLGRSMAQTRPGRKESDLAWAMHYVWDRLTDVVASNRKTLCVAVIGLRTDGTSNQLQASDGYENISVLQPLGQITMESLRQLLASITPSGTESGDAISAIVVAVDMMDKFTQHLKWTRRIVLVTDGRGTLDADGIDVIAKKMNDSAIQLTILGVDFDDAEYGVKEEDKPSVKALNEKTLRQLVGQCQDGVFATMAEAIHGLDRPRIRPIRPYKTYDGPLTLGDPAKYAAAMSINVERYFKTHLARPAGGTTVAANPEPGSSAEKNMASPTQGTDGIAFSSVKLARSYKVDDPNAPGGKRDVEFESLAKGFEYGRTAVHISESEHNITKLETHKGFSIVGFIPSNKYEPFLSMGEACVTLARPSDVKSQIALSSLIWALMELESYAVARIVVKDGKEPLLVLLAPHIDSTFECLYDVPLPFAEDVRSYQFPPLDKVLTANGKTLTKHRLLPSNELSEAMSDYVDAMDLSEYGADSNGAPAEYASMEDVFNPAIHRINHAIKRRAVNPDSTVSEMPAELLKFSSPPVSLIERVRGKIETLVRAADVKKVPPKVRGRRQAETAKPLSGLDVDALLGDEKTGQVSRENPIPDFKHALESAVEMNQIEAAAKQMGDIIRLVITDSNGPEKYPQAMECLGVMREELVEMEEPGFYNSFARDLKRALLSGALGGDRREFWLQMRQSKLGLISQDQSESSDIGPAEANEFYTSRQ